MNAPDGRSCILVGGSRYRTRIQDDNACLVRRPSCYQTTFFELPLDSRAIRLRRATSKVLDVEAGHGKIIQQSVDSLMPIAAGGGSETFALFR